MAANPTISQITVGNSTYDICDPVSRDATQNIETYAFSLVTANFHSYQNLAQNTPYLYKIGHIGFINGIIQPTNSFSTSLDIWAALPSLSLATHTTMRFLAQGSFKTMWLLCIGTNLHATAERPRNDLIHNNTWDTWDNGWWMPLAAMVPLQEN